MSLFWRRTNLPGAVAGLVSGAATVLIWDYLPIVNGQTIGNATGIYSLLVGFVISLCFIVIISMVTKAPDETILAQFDEYKKNTKKKICKNRSVNNKKCKYKVAIWLMLTS